MEDFNLIIDHMVHVEEVEIKCVVKLIEHINKLKQVLLLSFKPSIICFNFSRIANTWKVRYQNMLLVTQRFF